MTLAATGPAQGTGPIRSEVRAFETSAALVATAALAIMLRCLASAGEAA